MCDAPVVCDVCGSPCHGEANMETEQEQAATMGEAMVLVGGEATPEEEAAGDVCGSRCNEEADGEEEAATMAEAMVVVAGEPTPEEEAAGAVEEAATMAEAMVIAAGEPTPEKEAAEAVLASRGLAHRRCFFGSSVLQGEPHTARTSSELGQMSRRQCEVRDCMLAWECHWETAAYLTRSQRRAVGPEAVTEAATSKHGVGGMELGTKAATSKHHGGESGVGMEQGSQQSVKARAKERAMETGECWCHCNGDEFTWNMAADGVATVQ